MSKDSSLSGSEFLSFQEASVLAGLSTDYLQRLSRKGTLATRDIDGVKHVDRASFDAFLASRVRAREEQRERLSHARAEEYLIRNAKLPMPSFRVEDRFVAAKVAAQESGLSVDYIQRLAKSGAIKTGSIGSSTLIDRDSLHAFILERAKKNAEKREQVRKERAKAYSIAHLPLHEEIVVFAHEHKKFSAAVVALGERAVALTLALMLIFGSYTALDPRYASRAMEAITTRLGQPETALAAAGSLWPQSLSEFAKAVNQTVDRMVYTIAFPESLTDNGSRVAVEIAPYARPAVVNNQAPTVASTKQFQNSNSTQTVINQPVTERIVERTIERVVETKTVAEAGGLTDAYLTQKLSQLENKLSSQMLALSSANSTTIIQNYGVTAQSNKIDELNDVEINNPTITGGTISGAEISGGTISGASISGGAVSATSLNVSGETVLATTTVIGDITQTGSLTLTGTSSATGISASYATITNATIGAATSTNLFASLARFTSGIVDTLSSTFASIAGLTVTNSTTTNATTTNSYIANLAVDTASTTNATFAYATSTTFAATDAVITNATSTNFFASLAQVTTGIFSSLTASIASLTGLTVENATTTNATTTNSFATNLVATNATSTNLFASLARFTSGIVDNLSSTLASITGLTVTNSTTTNATTTNSYIANLAVDTASTTNATFAYATSSTFFASTASSTNLFAANASLGVLSAGTLAISSTLDVSGLATFASGFVSQASSTVNGAFTATGNTAIGGTLGVTGGTTLTNATSTNFFATTASSTNLFATNASLTNSTTTNAYISALVAQSATTTNFYTSRLSVDSLNVGSGIASHFVPAENDTYDLGSPSFFWRNAYIDTITVNSISAASTSIAGTVSSDFTLNSDNATADLEDMSLIFYRGSVVPNAVFSWNSAAGAKRFELNQATYIANQSGSTTQPTLTIRGAAGQTGNLIQAQSSAGTNLFAVAYDGSVTIATTTITALTTGTSTLTNLSVTNTSTSTFAGGLTIGGALEVTGRTLLSNATSTSFFATTASSTNLFATNAAFGSLTIIGATTQTGLATFANGFVSQASSTVVGNFTSTGIGTFASGAFTGTTGTTTIASGQGFTIGGSQFVLQQGSGNVGIGTSNPSATLEIKSVAAGDVLRAVASDGSALVDVSESGSGHGFIDIFDASGALSTRLFSSGASYFTGGNVGIGTTSPTNRLEVAGNTFLGGNLTATGTLAISGATTLSSTLNVSGNATLANATSTNFFATTASSTNLFATTAQFGSLTILGNTTQTGLATFANGFISQASSTIGNGTQTGGLTINGGATTTGNAYFAGNVGLGTTSPGSRLSVQGATDATVVNLVGSSNTQFTAVIQNGGGSGKALRLVTGSGSVSTATILSAENNSGTNFFTVTNGNSYFQNGNLGVGSTSPWARLAVQGGAASGITFQTTNSSLVPTMTVLDTGNVGIGTSSPNSLLAVRGGSASSVVNTGVAQFGVSPGSSSAGVELGTYIGGYGMIQGITFTSGAANALQINPFGGTTHIGLNGGAVSVGTTSAAYKTNIVGSSGSGYLAVGNTRPGDIFNITSSGNVGIGTTTPNAKLTVNGSIAVESNGAVLFQNAAGDPNNQVWTRNAGGSGAGFQIGYGSILAANTRLFLDSTGKLAIGGASTTPWAMLSVTATDNASEPQFVVASSSAVSLMVAANGNVGIGTNAPDVKLDVNGDADFGALSNSVVRVMGSSGWTGSLKSIGEDFYVQSQRNTSKLHLGGNLFPTAMTVDNTTGFVGIGTSSPTNRFEVAGNTFLGGNLTATGTLAISGATTLSSTLNVTGNTTLANATSTNFFATTASSTDLFATTASFGTLAANTLSLSSTLNVTGSTSLTTLTASGLATFTAGFVSQASSTIGNGTLGLTINGAATTTGDAWFGNTDGSGVSRKLTISTNQDASINLIADNNNAGGEDDNAWLYLSQDGGSVNGFVGLVGSAGNAPDATNSFTGTLANALLLGSLSNTAVQLGTNNVARLTVDVSGNVGIGTTSPGSILAVQGVGNFVASATSTLYSGLQTAALNVTGATTLGNTTITNATSTNFFATTASSTNLFATSASFASLTVTGATTYSGLATFASGFVSQASSTVVGNFTTTGIGTFASGVFTGTTGTTTIASGQGFIIGGSQFILQQGSGNVGIGTASPSFKLDVSGNARIADADDSLTLGTGSGISEVYYDSGTDWQAGTGWSGAARGADSFFLYQNGERFSVDSDGTVYATGNVGIGTSAPADALQVLGNLRVGQNTAYGDIIFATSTALSGYNGTLVVKSNSTPGSGTAPQALYLKNNVSGGTTRMDLLVGGRIGIGTEFPGSALEVQGVASAQSFNATSTAFTSQFSGGLIVTGTTTLANATSSAFAITSLTNALLSTNANGSVVATTSIGTNYLTGSLGTINGTTFNAGGSITITAASSTLLANNNTFSGTNTFTGNVTLANATSTTFFATTASSTNLFATTAAFGSLTVSGATTQTGLATFAAGFVSQASSTVVGNFTSTGIGTFASGVFTGTSGTTTIASGQGFTIGSSQFVLQQGSGNVGIGTTSPGTKLTIQSTTDLIEMVNSNVPSANWKFQITNDGFFQLNNGSDRLTVDTTGNLGIGTTTPDAKVSIVKANPSRTWASNSSVDVLTLENDTTTVLNMVGGATNNTGILFSSPSARGNGQILYSNSTNAFSFLTNGNGTARMTLDSSGNLGVGTTSPYAKLSVTNTGSAPSFVVEDASSDTTPFSIDASGNVGIGTLAPDAVLHVQSSSTASVPTNISAFNGVGYLYNASDQANYTGLKFQTRTTNSTMGMIALEYVSSLSDGAMSFKLRDSSTTNKEVLRLLANGSIGIGTSSPAAKLAVEGNIFGGAITATSTLTVAGNTTLSNATSTSFFATTASSTNLFATSASFGTLAANTLSLSSTLNVTGLATFASGFVSQASSTVVGNFTSTGIGTFASGAFTSTTGTTTIASGQGFTIGGSQFVLQQGSGNVGIGTTTPTRKLDVVGGNLAVTTAGSNSISAIDSTNSIQVAMGVSSLLRGFVGTVSDHSLDFRTDNTARMLIDTAGRVGIGTTSPQRLLHVSGDDLVRFDRTSSSFGASLLLTRIESGSVQSSWVLGAPNVASASGDDFSIVDYGTAVSGDTGTTRFLIDKTTGNVGIGTVSPQFKLHVASTTSGAETLPLHLHNDAVGDGTGVGISFGNTNTDDFSTAKIVNYRASTNDRGLAFSTYDGSTTAEKFRITGSGRVGVGTTTPWAKLSVTATDNTSVPQFVVASSSAVSLMVAANGALNIGTTSPELSTAKLTIDVGAAHGIAFGRDASFPTVPAISLDGSFSDSTMEGFFADASQNLYLNAGGVVVVRPSGGGSNSLFRFTSTGLSIGSASNATNKLDVSGGVAIGSFAVTNTAPTNGLIVSGNVAIGTTTSTALFNIATTPGSTSNLLRIASSTNQNIFTVASGIDAGGTGGPGAGGLIVGPGDGSSNNAARVILSDVGTNGGRNLALISPAAGFSGYITQRGTSGSLVINNDGSGGVGALVLQTASTSRLIIMNDGRVGVGSSDPTYQFQVTGVARFSSIVDAASFVATSSSATSLFNGALTVNGNTTLANATSTNFFATTASSTNLFAQSASFGSLTISGNTTQTGLATFAAGFVSQASSTVVGNFTSTGIGTFASGAFTGTTGTTTIASGQGLTIGGSQFVLQQGSGNVGIGTATPEASLTVNSSAATAAIFNRNNSSLSSAVEFRNTWGSVFAGISSGGNFAIGPSANLASSPMLTISTTTGMFAIGNMAGVDTPGVIRIGRLDSNSRFHEIISQVSATNANNWMDFALNLGTATSSVLRLTGLGNVGIGTSSPVAKLAVEGNIFGGAITATSTLTVAGNTTLANATSTNFFATTASSTNLFAQTASLGALSVGSLSLSGLATFAAGFVSQASSTVNGAFTATGTSVFGSNVGIGTTSPYARLSIAQTNATPIFVATGYDNDAASYNALEFTNENGVTDLALAVAPLFGSVNVNPGRLGIGTSSPMAHLTIAEYDNDSVGSVLALVDENDNTDFSITTSGSDSTRSIAYFGGNVGIGSSTPGSILSIQNVGNFVASATSTLYSGLQTAALNVTGATTLGSLTASGNTTLANATSTNFFATTASSTNLFAQTAQLGSLTVLGNTTHTGTLTQTGLATFTNGLIAQASSTIGSGTQAGGLTIFGGATTTQHLVVQGSATSTFTGGLQASGTGFRVNSSVAANSFALTNAGELGLGTASPLGRLYMTGTYTTSNAYAVRIAPTLASSVTTSQLVNSFDGNISPTGASLSNLYAMYSNPALTNSAVSVTSFMGNASVLESTGTYTGTVTTGYGYRALNPAMAGTNPVMTNYYGFFADATDNGVGTTTGTVNNYSFRSSSHTAAPGFGGTINNYGIYVLPPSGSGEGVTNNYGIRISGDGGTVTNTASTTNWALYIDSKAPTYLESTLTLGDTGKIYPSMLWVATSSVSTTTSQIGIRSARAAIVANNLLGGIDFWSNDTNLTAPGTRTAAIQAIANTTHTASALGTDITFNSTNGTAYGELMRLTGAGNLGIGTTSPVAKLAVEGNIFGGAIVATSTLTVTGNTTLANATSTNFFATTASSTNLFAQTASLGALSVGSLSLSGLATFAAGFVSQASSTVNGAFTATGATTLGSTLSVSGNTTLANATSTNFFATTASSTNLFAANATLGALSAGTLAVSGATTLSSTLNVAGRATFANASSTHLSVFGNAYFGGTATSSFSSDGQLTLGASAIFNNTGTDTKIQFRRTGGDNFSIEHDSTGMYFWNQTTGAVMAHFGDSGNNGDVKIGYHDENSLGKLGVGTSTPWAKISASTTAATPGLAIQQNGAGAAALFLGGNVGVGTTTPWGKLSVTATDNASTPQFVVASSSATAFFVGGNGRIGVNTISPGSAQLNVSLPSGTTQGVNVSTNQNASVAVFRGDNTDTTGNNAFALLQLNNNNANAYFAITGSGVATSSYIKPNGAFIRGDGFPGVDLAATNAAGTINFWTGGSNNRMTITSGGNVGVGTTSPAALLSVAGNGYLTGNLGVGTSNQSFNTPTNGIVIGGGKAGLRLESVTGGNTSVEIWADTNGLNFQNMNGGRNFVFTTGNVGIGHTAPSEKLNVQGVVAAQSFNATSTAFTSQFSGGLIVTGTTTLANATSTNFFATTASSTNLFATTASFGSLTISGATTQTGLATFAAGFVSQASSTVVGNLTATRFLGDTSSTTVLATGATTSRSLEDRFGEILNVKDFGAVGDGVTDDTAAINAAFAAGIYKSVYIPSGTYLHTGLTLPLRIHVYGEGESSVLKLATSSDTYSLKNTTGSSGIQLENFAINGNKSGQTEGSSSRGVYLVNATRAHIHGLLIYDTEDHGIHLSQSGTQYGNIIESNKILRAGLGDTTVGGSAVAITNSFHDVIADNVLVDSHRAGVRVSGTALTITGNTIKGNGNGGIVPVAASTTNITITGNTIMDNYDPDNGVPAEDQEGIRLVGIDGFTITGNTVGGNGGSGISVLNGSSGGVISSNICFNNGQSGTGSGIRIFSTGSVPSDITITGNRCFDDQDTKTQEYGLSIEDNAASTTFSGNYFAGNLTGGTNITASGTNITGSDNTTTDVLAWFTAGTERARLSAAGNFGIGTTSPFAKLSVGGSAYIGGNLTATGTLAISGATALSSTLGVSGLSTFTSGFVSQASSTVNGAFTATGATALGSTLTVAGNTTLANATSTNFFATTASSTNLFAQAAQLGSLTVLGNTTHTGTLTQTGLATFTNGFVSQASSSVVGNFTSTGIGSFASGAFTGTTGTTTIASGQGFTIGGSQFVVQQGSGNVGIGTTTPTTKFQVQGSGSFSGSVNSTTVGVFANTTAASTAASLSVVSGSTGQASLHLGGDGASSFNNGRLMYDASLNAMSLWTSDLERLTINSSGNVGIGTTSPYAKLSIAGASGGTSSLFAISTSTASATSTAFIVDSSGRVGINTSSPTQSLEVNGSILSGNGPTIPALKVKSTGTTAATASVGIKNTTTSGWSFIFSDYEPFAEYGLLYDNSSDRFMVTSGVSGSALFSNTITNESGSSRTAYTHWMMESDGDMAVSKAIGVADFTPDFRIEGSGTTGSGYFGLTNSVDGDIFVVNASGNVGIGTTSPVAKLEVNGNIFGGAITATSTLTVSGNTTLANATSTNFFATTASSTNLFASTAQLGSLTVLGNTTHTGTLTQTGLATFAAGFVSQASSTVVGNFTSTGVGTFASGAFTGTTGTTTIASGQGFTIGGSQLVVQQGSGRVGVGTTSPGTSLDVYASSAATGIRSINTTAMGSSSGGGFLAAADGIPTASDQGLGLIGFGARASGSTYAYGAQIEGNSAGAWSGSAVGAYLSFLTTQSGTLNRTEKMRLTDTGNLGIGTSTPQWKLQVAGTRPSIAISDTSDATNQHWLLSSMGGNFYVGTSTGAFATSTPPALALTNGGNLTVTGSFTTLNGNHISAGGVFRTGNYFQGANNANRLYLDDSFQGSGTAGTATFLNSTATDFRMLRFGGNTSSFAGLGAASTTQSLYVSRADGSLGGRFGVGTSSPYAKLSINLNPADSNIPSFVIASSTANATSTHFIVTNAGNVGIGTSTPGSIFAIDGVANLFSNATSTIYGALQTNNLIPGGSYTNNLSGYDLGATGQRWNALWAGAVNIGTSTFSLKSDTASNLGFYTSASGGGTQALTLTQSGNLGIGTTSPLATTAARKALVVQDTTAGAVLRLFGTADLELVGGLTSGFIGVRNSFPLLFSINNVTRMTLDTSGNLGIGTTTPTNKLEVAGGAFIGGNLVATGTLSVASSATIAGGTVWHSGNDGAGSGLDADTLDGISSGTFGRTDSSQSWAGTQTFGAGSFTTLYNAGNQVDGHFACQRASVDGLIGFNSTCSQSDERLKENIETLAPERGLDAIRQLRAVEFDWKDERRKEMDGHQLGFVAQEVMQLFPELVGTTHGTTTVTLADGTTQEIVDTHTLNYMNLTAPLVLAVQELDKMLNAEIVARGYSTTTADQIVAVSTGFEWSAFSSSISAGLRSALQELGTMAVTVFKGAIFASAGVFDKVFAKEVTTDQLCVSDESGKTCITRAQLDALLAGAAAPSSPSAPSESSGGTGGQDPDAPDTDTPVITVSGANPATINVGDLYSDLGASVFDAGSPNIGISASVDGGATTSIEMIWIDTSVPGTHTILYSATDQEGNTGTAERVVNVVDPSAASTPSDSSSDETPSTPSSPSTPSESSTDQPSDEPTSPFDGSPISDETTATSTQP